MPKNLAKILPFPSQENRTTLAPANAAPARGAADPPDADPPDGAPAHPAGAATGFKGGDTSAAHSRNMTAVRRHISRLRRHKLPLPARPSRPGKVWVAEFAREAGISKEVLLRHGSALRLELEAAVVELGVGVRLRLTKRTEPRLKDAMAFALAGRRRDNVLQGLPAEFGIAELRSVYYQAVKLDRLGMEAEAAAAFALLAARAAAGRGVLTGGQRRAFAFAEDCLKRQLEHDGLPEDFAGALSVAIVRAGLTPTLLAQQVGAVPQTVINWARGRKAPDRRFEPLVARIETVLGLEPGQLISRIVRARLGAGRLPIALFPARLHGPKYARLRARIAKYLPDDIRFRGFDEAQRIVSDASERCEREEEHGSAHGNLIRARYALKDWPAKAAAEFERLRLFKQPIIADEDTINLKPWSDYTVSFRRGQVGGYYGFRLSDEAGDWRVGPDELSLALFADARSVQAYIEYKSARVAKAHGMDNKSVTGADADLMGLGAQFFRKDGFVRRDKAMRAALGYGAKPNAAWIAYCEKKVADYKERARKLRANATRTRDPHAPVKAILRLDEPLSAIKLLVDGLDHDYRKTRTGSKTAAELLQDQIYVQMQAQAPFRPGTTVTLEYRADNTGHLRRDALGWFLMVPKELFKNGDGQALEHDFYRRLVDQWRFYARLDQFLANERFVLLQRLASPYLFVYAVEQLPKILAAARRPRLIYAPLKAALAGRVRAFTARHLGGNKKEGSGIEGIKSFSPSGFRHIVATSVVKRSGSFKEAADVIADSEPVTRLHYAQYRPSDRAERLGRTQADSARAACAGADALRMAARQAARGLRARHTPPPRRPTRPVRRRA